MQHLTYHKDVQDGTSNEWQVTVMDDVCYLLKYHESLCLKEKKITSAYADDEQLKLLYQTVFLKNEQISWDDLMRLVEEMHLDFTVLELGKTIVILSSFQT